MDWSTAAVIYAPIVEAIGIVITACAALGALTTWRREMIGRRRADLAIDTLAKFYRARDLLGYIRAQGSIGPSGTTRPRAPHETQAETEIKDAYYAPVERLIEHSEFFAKMNAKRTEFMAVFGPDAARPFDEMDAIKRRVQLSAHMLITTHRNGRNYDQELVKLTQKWNADIGWVDPQNDPLREEIEQIISDMVGICSPIISGPTPWWKKLHRRMLRHLPERFLKAR